MPENNSAETTENSSTESVISIAPQRLVVLPWLYMIMLGLFIAAPFTLFLGLVALLPLGLLALFLLVTLVLGIVTIVNVRRSHGLLADHGYGSASVVLPLMIVAASACMLLSVSIVIGNMMGQGGWELEELWYDLKEYADSNEGRYPPAESWCDSLKSENGKPWMRWSHNKQKTPVSRFAMNEDAIPLGRTMPKDMVLAFSSSEGWNQVGGLELARPIYIRRIAVLFGDGHVELVQPRDIKYLRWRVTDTGKIPERHAAAKLTIISLAWAVVLTICIIAVRKYLAGRSGFVSGLATAAGIAGALLGLAGAGFLYNDSFPALFAGLFAGSISGIMVAAIFAGLLVRHLDKGFSRESLQPFAHVAGMAAGAVCAAATHSVIMAASGETSFLPLLGGVGFGMYAGVIVGDISARTFVRLSSRLLAGEQNAVS